MTHPHVWLDYVKDTLAFYSKRADRKTADLIWIKGDVDHCMFCDDLRIRPHQRGLAIVPVLETTWALVPFVMGAA